jgi:hypothetical protein
VGSVRIHAVPGMARRFREPRWCDLPVCGRVHRSPSVVLYVDLNLLQSPAVGLQSVIGQKIVLRTGTLQGVRLRDGDRIVSLRSKVRPYSTRRRRVRRWCRRQLNRRGNRTGALYSHIPFRLLARRTYAWLTRSYRGSWARTKRTLSFEDGDRVHLTLVWDDEAGRSTP